MGRSNKDELRFTRRREFGGWETFWKSGTFLCAEIGRFYELPRTGVQAVILVASSKAHPQANRITPEGRVQHDGGKTYLQSPGVRWWLENRYFNGRRYVRVEYELLA